MPKFLVQQEVRYNLEVLVEADSREALRAHLAKLDDENLRTLESGLEPQDETVEGYEVLDADQEDRAFLFLKDGRLRVLRKLEG